MPGFSGLWYSTTGGEAPSDDNYSMVDEELIDPVDEHHAIVVGGKPARAGDVGRRQQSPQPVEPLLDVYGAGLSGAGAQRVGRRQWCGRGLRERRPSLGRRRRARPPPRRSRRPECRCTPKGIPASAPLCRRRLPHGAASREGVRPTSHRSSASVRWCWQPGHGGTPVPRARETRRPIDEAGCPPTQGDRRRPGRPANFAHNREVPKHNQACRTHADASPDRRRGARSGLPRPSN